MSTNSEYTIPLVDDDTILESPKSHTKDPSKYVPDLAPDSPIHYNLRALSYSGLNTLHSCPRKFELYRLQKRDLDPDNDPDENGHLDFGTVVGNGIQELLVTKDMNKAMFRAFLDWKDNLDSERGEKSGKTFWHALLAIQQFTEIMNGPLSKYELAYYQGKPAVELGFRIDCGGGFVNRGKLDALMIHKTTGEFLPIECKTTGMKFLHEAMYGNSDQGLGYGVVIDRVAHEMGIKYSSYRVFYPVYQTFRKEWTHFDFPKSNTARALWLQNLLLSVQTIQTYAELGYFPTRGNACFSFNKECSHYGTCHLDNSILIGDIDKVPIKLDKVTDYPLEFDIDQLVEAQVAKMEVSSE